jgi:hypothetical protein
VLVCMHLVSAGGVANCLLYIESTDWAVPESADTTPCVMSARRCYNNSCDNSRSMDRSHSDSGRILASGYERCIQMERPQPPQPGSAVGRPAGGTCSSHWSGKPVAVVVVAPMPRPRARVPIPIGGDDRPPDRTGPVAWRGVAAYVALATTHARRSIDRPGGLAVS